MTKERRQFTREFKLEAISRFEAAPNAKELANELGVRRELPWSAPNEAREDTLLFSVPSVPLW